MLAQIFNLSFYSKDDVFSLNNARLGDSFHRPHGRSSYCGRKNNSKILNGQTDIVKSEDRQDYGNKMKRKTNIEHTTLHLKQKLE